jgi:hypothetical protein
MSVDDGCLSVGDGCVIVGDGCMSVGDGCLSVGDGCVIVGEGCVSEGEGIITWTGEGTRTGGVLEVGEAVGLGGDKVGGNVVCTMLIVGDDVFCTAVGVLLVGAVVGLGDSVVFRAGDFVFRTVFRLGDGVGLILGVLSRVGYGVASLIGVTFPKFSTEFTSLSLHTLREIGAVNSVYSPAHGRDL